MTLLVIITMSCRSNDDSLATESPEPNHTVEVSVTPNPTVLPSPVVEPTSTVVDEVTATELAITAGPSDPTATILVIEPDERVKPPSGVDELPLSDLEYSTCKSTRSNGQGGTAPAPTPTREPKTDDSVPSSTQTVVEYVTVVRSITADLGDWRNAFNSAWQYDLSPSQQAAALTELERRSSNLCEAMGLISPPHEFVGIHSLAAETVRVQHAWSVIAIQELLDTGSAQLNTLDEGHESTRLLIGNLKDAQSGEFAEVDSAPVLVEFPVTGIRFELPVGWYVRGTQRNPIIVLPFEMQSRESGGFGPADWDNGVSVRIRRFRNSGPTTSAQAVERFSGLFNLLGEPVSESNGALLGVDAVYTAVESTEGRWDFTVITAVVADDTFVIDYGCPQNNPEWCVAVQDVVESFSKSAG
jgi:hypothetical protein